MMWIVSKQLYWTELEHSDFQTQATKLLKNYIVIYGMASECLNLLPYGKKTGEIL